MWAKEYDKWRILEIGLRMEGEINGQNFSHI